MLLNNLMVKPQSMSLVLIGADLVEKSLKMLQKARTHAQECGLNTDTIEDVARILDFFSTLLRADVDVGDRLNAKLVHTSCATLMEFGDACTEILTEAIDLIFRVSDVMSSGTFCQILIVNGYVPLIVKYMVNENPDVRADAIAIVGNLMMIEDDVTTSIMRSSVFNHVSRLLFTDEHTISQVALMMCSAMEETMSDCMTTVVFDHSLLPILVSLLQSSCCEVVVNSLGVISNLFGYNADEQKWRLLKHDKHGVLSTVIPLLSAELCKQPPSEEIISPLCNIFQDILEFISNGEERDVSDLHVMFKNEMKKDVYAQRDENSDYRIDRIVSLLEDREEDTDEDVDEDTDEDIEDTDEDLEEDTAEDIKEDTDEDVEDL